MRSGWKLLLGALGALGVLALLSAASTTAYFAGLANGGGARAEAYDVEPDARVAIVMDGMQFQARSVVIPAGALVELALENRDATLHTFTYALDGATRDHVVEAGETVRVLTRVEEPGSVHFWCRPHSAGASETRAEAMHGELVAEA